MGSAVFAVIHPIISITASFREKDRAASEPCYEIRQLDYSLQTGGFVQLVQSHWVGTVTRTP
jgi:hypothetical protein